MAEEDTVAEEEDTVAEEEDTVAEVVADMVVDTEAVVEVFEGVAECLAA